MEGVVCVCLGVECVCTVFRYVCGCGCVCLGVYITVLAKYVFVHDLSIPELITQMMGVFLEL